MENVILFFQNKGGDTIELISETVNVPTESQIRNMTLSHNYSTHTLSVKVATFGNFIRKHCPK